MYTFSELYNFINQSETNTIYSRNIDDSSLFPSQSADDLLYPFSNRTIYQLERERENIVLFIHMKRLTESL